MSDVEQRARDMGWKPLEEFKGDPNNWKSAEDFVRIGENYMPVLKERLEKMESDLQSVRGELKQKSKSLDKLASWHRNTYKRQYEKALADIRAEMRKAVAQGDTDRYELLEEQENRIKTEQVEEQASIDGGDLTVPEYYEFLERNSWYTTDPEMTMYANGLQAILVQQGITDNKQFFTEVEKRVRTRFPEKFRNDRQTQPAAVEGADNVATDTNLGKKGWADLPEDARIAYQNNFTELMKKDEYAKEYWLQEGV